MRRGREDGALHAVGLDDAGDVDSDTAGSADHAVPEDVGDGRREQGEEDQLADGAPLGDTGDEDRYERRPGHPPGPVEDGPAAQPVGLVADPRVEAHRQEVEHVLSGGADRQIDEEQRRTQEQHEEPDPDEEPRPEVAEELDAFLEPRVGGDREQERQDPDDEVCRTMGAEHPTVLILQPGGDLEGDETGGGGQAAQRDDHREDVEHFAPTAAHAVAADHVVESGREPEGQAFVVSAHRHRHGEHGVIAQGVSPQWKKE